MTDSDRRSLADEASDALAVPDAGSTAFVQVLGHKADLMIICFRRGFEPLALARNSRFRARRCMTCSSRRRRTCRSSSLACTR